MMNLMKQAAIAAVALVVAAGAAGAQSVVKVDGSSTVYPVTEAVAEEFQKENNGTQVTVGISGTGGGFKKFVRGEIDISDASRPILAKEMEEAKANGIEYIELPVAFDALTVVVNPKADWVDHLSIEELKKVWGPDSKIKNWKDVRSGFPDKPLTLYGPGTDSGTFDYFTEAINGKSKASRSDFTASEDDNVLVKGVANDVGALGYFGYAYYAENKGRLKAVPVVGKGGKPVAPSEKTVVDASYEPLSRPIFIYVNKKALERPEVRKFVEFYLKEVPDLAADVKYVPLPASAYSAGMQRVQAGKTGSAFGGHPEVGLHIDELFKRELKS
jgi:phosphate transport system substrate-binding protein